MTEREAFEEWIIKYPLSDFEPIRADDLLAAWQTACHWQRERDAEICKTEWNGDSDTYLYTEACNECADAILNQGEKND